MQMRSASIITTQIKTQSQQIQACWSDEARPSAEHSPCVALLTPICAPSSAVWQPESENRRAEYFTVPPVTETLVNAYTASDDSVTMLHESALTVKHVGREGAAHGDDVAALEALAGK